MGLQKTASFYVNADNHPKSVTAWDIGECLFYSDLSNIIPVYIDVA